MTRLARIDGSHDQAVDLLLRQQFDSMNLPRRDLVAVGDQQSNPFASATFEMPRITDA